VHILLYLTKSIGLINEIVLFVFLIILTVSINMEGSMSLIMSLVLKQWQWRFCKRHETTFDASNVDCKRRLKIWSIFAD